MSLFGTFRKKGKKVPSTFGKKSSIKRESIFSSTPNLFKVSSVGGSTFKKSTSSWKLYQAEPDDNDISNNEILFPSQNEDTKDESSAFDSTFNTSDSGDTCIAGSSVQTNSVTKVPEKESSISGMRNFMSMVSMASSLKRGKKPSKKPSFAASTSSLHRLESERREAIIFEDFQNPPSSSSSTNINNSKQHDSRNNNSLKPTTMLKVIKSAPTLDVRKHSHSKEEHQVEDDEDELLNIGGDNTEPGVISSSSSTSSCNTDKSDTGSIASSSTYYSTSSLSRSTSKFSSLGRSKPKPPKDVMITFETSVNTKYVQDINKTQLMLQGAKKFNMDPKRGIDYLVLNGIIERTPEDVAQFLKDGEGLSKTAIGNYLGEYIEFNLNVLQAFVDLHDFTNVLLVQALRQFLWSFRLPGESQKIDRLMECFAKRYCQLNPHLFENSDTCYLLSFAIIMLNTSLHNPNVKEKTTLEQFIRMTDDGHQLDKEFITSLYSSIQEEPFKIPQEDGNDFMLTFFNPDIEGWLWKQGGRYKSWKRRWLILSNNCLYYFRFTTDRVPRGIIPLENIGAKPLSSSSIKNSGKHSYCFTLYKKQSIDSHHLHVTDYIKSCKTLNDGQTVPGQHSTYNLATITEADRTKWITAISQNSSSHDFYTFLAQKKSKLHALSTSGGSSSRRGTTLGSTGKKSRSSTKHAQSVRKSQISLPLTASTSSINMKPNSNNFEILGDSSTVEYNYFNYLVNPEKNPHNYFLTLPNTKSSTHHIGAQSNKSEEDSATDEDVIKNKNDESVTMFSTIQGDKASDRISGGGDGELKNENDFSSVYGSDFLIKKYSLPIQESTNCLLRRYNIDYDVHPKSAFPAIKVNLIGPEVENVEGEEETLVASHDFDMNDFVKQEEIKTVLDNETDNDDQVNSFDKEVSENEIPNPVNPESTEHVINSMPLDISDSYLEIQQSKTTPDSTEESLIPVDSKDENPCGIIISKDIEHSTSDTTIPEISDQKDLSERILKNKRKTYSKETSLERHVEEILEKQRSCTVDLERVKISNNIDELEKIENCDRTVERVTSFSKTIITTTVTKSVQPLGGTSIDSIAASGGGAVGGSSHYNLVSSSSTDNEKSSSSPSQDMMVIQDAKDSSSQVTNTNINSSSNNDDNLVVETYNSVIIGNVRHTEV